MKIKIPAAILFLAGMVFLSFIKIDDFNPVMTLVNNIALFIPSISSTSRLSDTPNSAKLILAICWITIIPVTCLRLKNINKINHEEWVDIGNKFRKFVGSKSIILAYIIFTSILFLLLYALANYSPLGGYSHRRLFLSTILSYHNIAYAFWGFGITIGVSAALILIFQLSYGLIANRFK